MVLAREAVSFSLNFKVPVMLAVPVRAAGLKVALTLTFSLGMMNLPSAPMVKLVGFFSTHSLKT